MRLASPLILGSSVKLQSMLSGKPEKPRTSHSCAWTSDGIAFLDLILVLFVHGTSRPNRCVLGFTMPRPLIEINAGDSNHLEMVERKGDAALASFLRENSPVTHHLRGKPAAQAT